ncbi:unnamed protein product [Polarella glacialis]|uniref:Uncharacterized protein n=2 Tax=Polarella glacialis TaxID=89957 RepID=A0A813ITQ1_POLGL|nr:unnamed protein product [Polarella glacialis]
MLESQSGELDSIKASTGAAPCSLKDDLEGLKASKGSNSELQSMLESQRGELDSIKASTGAALCSLKDDLEGLKASNGSNADLQCILESQRAELDSIKASARREDSALRSSGCASHHEGPQLQEQVAALATRVDSLVAAAAGIGIKHNVLPELAELALGLQQDEEAEAGAHTRILAVIDDLCCRLAEVESSGEVAGSRGGSCGFSETILPEFTHKFESLAARVQEMQQVGHLMEVKLADFVHSATVIP